MKIVYKNILTITDIVIFALGHFIVTDHPVYVNAPHARSQGVPGDAPLPSPRDCVPRLNFIWFVFRLGQQSVIVENKNRDLIITRVKSNLFLLDNTLESTKWKTRWRCEFLV